MVDFRVDDGFHLHPKTVGLPLDAIGLWTLAGSWCARYLTDGYIPDEVLRGFAGRRSAAIQALVERNLIQQIERGYLFTDWLDYQRSRAEVEEQRELNRQRAARARARKRDPTSESNA